METDKEHVLKLLKEYGVAPESVTSWSYDKGSKTTHVGLKHFSYLRVLKQFESLDVRFRSLSPTGFEVGVQISENILIFDDEKEKYSIV